MKAAAVVCAAAYLVLAAPASATLVYQRAETREIVAARDFGSEAHVIAHGVYPVVSPSGRWVAFAKRHGSDFDLKLVGIDSGQTRLLMRHFPACTCGAAVPGLKQVWSPDSRYIVADNVSDGVPRLIDTAKDSKRDLPFGAGGASFSPDATRIAASVGGDGSRIRLWVYNIKHRAHQRVAFGNAPAWGRGGLAFAADAGLKLKETLDQPARLLMPRMSRQGFLYAVDWSAPGDKLLAAAGPTQFSLKAYLITPKSGSVTPLAATFSEVDALSRHGRWVLGVSGGNVVAVKADGTTRILARHALSASWTK